MKKSKRLAAIIMAAATAISLTACGTSSSGSFDTTKMINVISREDGSGTRGAFVELMGIEQKDASGTKKDMTTKEAVIVSKTDVMLTNVSTDTYAIGYVSLGSLNNNVKALQVDGIDATPENVKNGSYKVARPFNIATTSEPEGLAKDFINFIMSKEGQDVVSNGYIKISDSAPSFTSEKPAGKIVVGGSSSVTPIMEKLKEAYIKINPSAEIEVQMSDSTSGMTGTIDGTYDIGMASRELKDSEKAKLTSTSIALDGIAVIVNTNNTTTSLSSEKIKDIYTGDITAWSDAIK